VRDLGALGKANLGRGAVFARLWRKSTQLEWAIVSGSAWKIGKKSLFVSFLFICVSSVKSL
jgi:hypothetical protein